MHAAGLRLNKSLSAMLAAAILVSGCESMDSALKTGERAASVVSSPSARSIANIASADNREAAAREALKSRGRIYEENPQALINDIRQAQRDYQKLVNLLTGRVTKTWGKGEVKIPTKTHYVKYTQNYMSRAVVDFDAAKITVETLDEKDPKSSLRNAIVTTLLTPNDPRAVDLYSDSAVKLSSEREPYLKGLVLDHRGRPVTSPAEAEPFADHLLGGSIPARTVKLERGEKTAHYVEIPMVTNLANRQAEKYQPVVAKYAEKYKVSQSLVFAVIRTESNFNPFAVSSAPAYGMMQLVPSSGGRAAWRQAYGEDAVPTREDLFDPEKNIHLGSAYLNVLSYSQLDAIGNMVSREYCVISAYNTGPGNVLRTFHSNRTEAVNQINRLEPPAVYEKLRTSLPYAETRQYLEKVVGYRRQFVAASR